MTGQYARGRIPPAMVDAGVAPLRRARRRPADSAKLAAPAGVVQWPRRWLPKPKMGVRFPSPAPHPGAAEAYPQSRGSASRPLVRRTPDHRRRLPGRPAARRVRAPERPLLRGRRDGATWPFSIAAARVRAASAGARPSPRSPRSASSASRRSRCSTTSWPATSSRSSRSTRSSRTARARRVGVAATACAVARRRARDAALGAGGRGDAGRDGGHDRRLRACWPRRSAPGGARGAPSSRRWRSATGSSRRSATSRPRSAPPSSAPGSRASCTTSWPTRCRSSSCRPTARPRAPSSGRRRPPAALRTIGDTGREALAQMRRLLGVLRAEPAAAARSRRSRAPRSSTRSWSRSRSAGVPGGADGRGGAARRSPREVDVTVYRLAQEALTNVLKHARPRSIASTSCSRYRDDAVELLRRATTAAARAPGDGGGHGLVGMRERVDLHDGTLAAGPARRRRLRGPRRDPGGGVSARIFLVDDQALVRAGFRDADRGAARHGGRRRGRRRPRRAGGARRHDAPTSC